MLALAAAARAQVTTNPVDRKVTNPITDTPNVNPLQQDPPPVRPKRPAEIEGGMQSTEGLDVRSGKQTVSGPEDARVFVHEGNVDARVGIYRLQADKVTVYEATNIVIAEGNVVFDQGQFQRITGSRAEWNYATKIGFFVNATGFSNQTDDGTIIYFTADRVEKIAGNKVVVLEGEITACGDDEVPKWSFHTKRAVITLNDRVRGKNASFRIKGVPVGYLPFFSVSIKPRDRASGFPDADLLRLRQEGLPHLERLLPDARALGGHHLQQRHLHGPRARHRRGLAHARQLALVPQRRLLRRQGSHLRRRGRPERPRSGRLLVLR